MKRYLGILLALALAAGGVALLALLPPGGKGKVPGPREQAPARDDPKAVAALERLNASLERDASARGKPVVGVTLRGPEAGDDALRHVARLPGLRKLLLQGTRVGDAGLAHLKDLKNLQILQLDGAFVGDAGLAHLAGLTGLRTLRLGSTAVTDKGLEALAGMTEMETLV